MKFFDKSDGVSPDEYMKNHNIHRFGYGYPPRRFANNVKVYNLGLTSEQLDAAFRVINQDIFFDDIDMLVRCADVDNVYFGGRSGGWIYIDKDTDEVNYDELVAFDKLCDEMRDTLIWYCNNAKFEMRTVMVPHEYEAMILPGDEEE